MKEIRSILMSHNNQINDSISYSDGSSESFDYDLNHMDFVDWNYIKVFSPQHNVWLIINKDIVTYNDFEIDEGFSSWFTHLGVKHFLGKCGYDLALEYNALEISKLVNSHCLIGYDSNGERLAKEFDLPLDELIEYHKGMKCFEDHYSGVMTFIDENKIEEHHILAKGVGLVVLACREYACRPYPSK